MLLSMCVSRTAVGPGATRSGQSFGSADSMGVSSWCSTDQGVSLDCKSV